MPHPLAHARSYGRKVGGRRASAWLKPVLPLALQNSIERDKRVSIVLVRAVAACDFAPRKVPPLGKVSVAGDRRVNEREVQSHRPIQRERFGVDAFAAANVDTARQRFGDRERIPERSGDMDARCGEGAIARDHDGTPSIESDVRPGLVTHPAEAGVRIMNCGEAENNRNPAEWNYF